MRSRLRLRVGGRSRGTAAAWAHAEALVGLALSALACAGLLAGYAAEGPYVRPLLRLDAWVPRVPDEVIRFWFSEQTLLPLVVWLSAATLWHAGRVRAGLGAHAACPRLRASLALAGATAGCLCLVGVGASPVPVASPLVVLVAMLGVLALIVLGAPPALRAALGSEGCRHLGLRPLARSLRTATLAAQVAGLLLVVGSPVVAGLLGRVAGPLLPALGSLEMGFDSEDLAVRPERVYGHWEPGPSGGVDGDLLLPLAELSVAAGELLVVLVGRGVLERMGEAESERGGGPGIWGSPRGTTGELRWAEDGPGRP